MDSSENHECNELINMKNQVLIEFSNKKHYAKSIKTDIDNLRKKYKADTETFKKLCDEAY